MSTYFQIMALGGERVTPHPTDIQPLSSEFSTWEEARAFFVAHRPSWQLGSNHEYESLPYILWIEGGTAYYTTNTGVKDSPVIMAVEKIEDLKVSYYKDGKIRLTNTGGKFSWEFVES